MMWYLAIWASWSHCGTATAPAFASDSLWAGYPPWLPPYSLSTPKTVSLRHACTRWLTALWSESPMVQIGTGPATEFIIIILMTLFIIQLLNLVQIEKWIETEFMQSRLDIIYDFCYFRFLLFFFYFLRTNCSLYSHHLLANLIFVIMYTQDYMIVLA